MNTNEQIWTQMNANEKITKRREALGLSDIEMAEHAGITLDSYCDIEWHADEVFEQADLGAVKKICDVLQLDVLELFGVECFCCAQGVEFPREYQVPRNQLVASRRVALGMSREALGDRVGFEEVAIRQMEEDADFLETWSFDLIRGLADVIAVPLQVLLGASCARGHGAITSPRA